MIDNPWHRLPAAADFVLPEDEEIVRRFNEKATRRHELKHLLHLDLVPEAFLGRPDAPVVLLGNNPGVESEETAQLRRNSGYIRRVRENLMHRLPSTFPFMMLEEHPDISSASRNWWERKLKHLRARFGAELLANVIFAVEFFPYVSNRFGVGNIRVPSQEYSFGLVKKAMRREAVIVLTRGQRRWLTELPELAQYPHLVKLREPQRALVSPGNCGPDGYEMIIRKIADASGVDLASTQATTRAVTVEKDTHGLAGIGVSGGWEIALDETTKGITHWLLQITGPATSFMFEVMSDEMVRTAINFLEADAAHESADELILGQRKKIPVMLVRDEEFSDRFFLVVGPREAPVFEYTIGGSDLNHFRVALQQVQADLDS